MPSGDLDVVVVGAGVAGLTALEYLDRAGCNAICVEARDRIGGRVWTVHDPLSPLSIELGAEFIHGRPPEIWDIVNAAELAVYNGADSAVHLKDGNVEQRDAPWDLVKQVLDEMQRAAERGPDQSFQSFLDSTAYPPDVKQAALGYVQGFNAAHKDVIGIASLAQDARAAAKIDGDRITRLVNGYDAIPLHILRSVSGHLAKLRLNSVVESIAWQPGSASIHIRSTLTGALKTIRARRVVITVPLGVLQADVAVDGAIRFQPVPVKIFEAARTLCSGHVFRVVLRFREAFWEANPELADAGFLLSRESLFPTWWTPLAVRAPVITGWSAGPNADDLLGRPRDFVIARALSSLARVTGTRLERLHNLVEAVYFHDWQADPYARGAYSYAPVGARQVREVLAEPVADTLFFAGEATDSNGYSATVHGAIASGKRAAAQITRTKSYAAGQSGG